MPPPYDRDAALAALAAADPVMAHLITAIGGRGPEPRTFTDPFTALLRSIVYQQLSGKAAATIHGRVEALFDGPPTPQALLDLPDEALRGAGLSRAKLAAARDLARHTLTGTVPPHDALATLPDDEIVERLTQVRGIGRWTVEMLLLFWMDRPDVLPVTDLGVRKGFMMAYGLDDLPTPSALRAHGERWRPYRSLASWFLWRATDTPF